MRFFNAKKDKMKRIRISFEEEDKETIYILIGNLFGDKKVLKEKIDEIIEEVFGK